MVKISNELLHYRINTFPDTFIYIKGPNLNVHPCQRSGPEQLVITKLVFNKHTVAYITCITNKHKLFEKSSLCIQNTLITSAKQLIDVSAIEVDGEGLISCRCRHLEIRAADGQY